MFVTVPAEKRANFLLFISSYLFAVAINQCNAASVHGFDEACPRGTEVISGCRSNVHCCVDLDPIDETRALITVDAPAL